MIKAEFLRLLRSDKWKYILVVIALSALYYIAMRSNEPTTLSPIFAIMTPHKNLLIGIATMPSFLYAYLLYHIAMEEESIQTWYTTLAYPIPQQIRMISKAIVLLVFLIPGCLLSVITCFWLLHAIPYDFLTFMFSIHSIYFICFFFYCFYVAQGYIIAAGTIMSINILQRFAPLALFVCILNTGAWIKGFSLLWWKMGILFLLMFITLLIISNYTMHSKIYREIVLTKLFQIKPQSIGEMTADKYKSKFDTLLQFVFQKLERKKSATYWKTCAVLEVTIKQYFFSIFFIVVFLILGILFKNIIAGAITILFIVNVVYHFYKEKKLINRVCIRAIK